MSSFLFYVRRLLILFSLEDPIRDCHDRYLVLPTLGWLQYGIEVYSLHMAIRTLLKRLDDVRRDIEVCLRQVHFVILFVLTLCSKG
jgi:hypothetical protein